MDAVCVQLNLDLKDKLGVSVVLLVTSFKNKERSVFFCFPDSIILPSDNQLLEFLNSLDLNEDEGNMDSLCTNDMVSRIFQL